jgi:3-deoxy-D-manno-octulosonic-acid transferase
LHGPHVHNFSDIYATIDGVGGAPSITDAASLADVIAGFLDDPEARRRFAGKTADALAPFSGALAATMAALDPYLATGGRR